MTKRSFDDSFWGDPFVQGLDKDAKLLFAYLWTNKRCNSAGLYETTIKTISFDTGIPEANIPKLFTALHPKVQWVADHNLIWVKNFLKHQPQSPLFLKSVCVCLQNLSGNGIIRSFLDYNTSVGVSIPYQYPIGMVSDGYGNIPEQEPEQDIDIEPLGTKGDSKGELAKKSYGEGELCQLTDLEYGKLKDRLGEQGRDFWINKVCYYVGSKGKRYKSHYMTILNWASDTRGNFGVNQNKQPIRRPVDGLVEEE